jgi:hypothetical protein
MKEMWSAVARHVQVCRSSIAPVALIALLPGALSAQTITDVKGGKDHPLVSRYAGSVMLGYRFHEFDEFVMPLGLCQGGGAGKADNGHYVSQTTALMLPIVVSGPF